MAGTDLLTRLAKSSQEPAWLTDRRRAAVARHAELPWPHPSDDVWRRTDVTQLDPSTGFTPADRLQQALSLTDDQLAQWTKPLGGEQLFVRANDGWLNPPRASGLVVADLAAGADRLRDLLEADGMTPAESKLASLNDAYHQGGVVLDVPAGASLATPVRLVHLHGVQAGQAIYPLTVIRVGAGASVTLVDEYVSLEPAGGAEHLINGRIELRLERDARVQYVRLQRWGGNAREFLLQRARLGAGASLTMANLTLGARLSKTHIVNRFDAPGASSKLYGFVFGRGRQHIDQHTLQDHQAPQTTSDLEYRAALQDTSRLVYTGLIRIGPTAQQTNAFQANHNLLLSAGARAETIPMLEILADDVQCKHGASIGPIDEEQAFYAMTRGISRQAAERLIVMGYVEPIIQQVPVPALQERLREEIEGSLHAS